MCVRACVCSELRGTKLLRLYGDATLTHTANMCYQKTLSQGEPVKEGRDS